MIPNGSLGEKGRDWCLTHPVPHLLKGRGAVNAADRQAGCVEGLAVCPGSVASGEFLLSHRVAKNGGLGLTRG